MRAEKRGPPSDSLPKQTETGRGKWENDISFPESLKEKYKDFIDQYLELRQQLWRYGEPHVRDRDLRDFLWLSLAWHKTRAVSGYLQRTGEGPVGYQGYVSVSFITHKVLCGWKKSHDHCSQSSPAVGQAFPHSF